MKMKKSICLRISEESMVSMTREVFAISDNLIRIHFKSSMNADWNYERYSPTFNVDFPDDPIFEYCLNKIIENSEDEQLNVVPSDNEIEFGKVAYILTGTFDEVTSCFNDKYQQPQIYPHVIKREIIDRYLVYIFSALDLDYEYYFFENAMKNKDSIVESVKKEYTGSNT